MTELKRISQAAALVGERSDAADAYQRLIEQSVENRPISTLTLERDGELLATFERPMSLSSRPILDLLTPRAPFSYRQHDNQESEHITTRHSMLMKRLQISRRTNGETRKRDFSAPRQWF